MPDLSLVPLDDLMAEVLTRVDHGVIALMQVGIDGGNTLRVRRWKGNYEAIAGLAALTVLTIGLDQRTTETDVREF